MNFSKKLNINVSGQYLLTTIEESENSCAFGETKSNCPILSVCESAIDEKLSRCYGFGTAMTLKCESTSCPVLRSEVSFHKKTGLRLALRKHIHEVSRSSENRFEIGFNFIDACIRSLRKRHLTPAPGDVEFIQSLEGSYSSSIAIRLEINQYIKNNPECNQTFLKLFTAFATSPMRCHSFPDSIKVGRYLGFVDVRLRGESPISLAVLAPPRALLARGDVKLILNEYGQFFGGPNFASSVFSAHDRNLSGAQCAQSCVLMAIANLMPFRSKPQSPLDISIVAKSKKQNEVVDCKNVNQSNIMLPNGLTFPEMLTALKYPKNNVSVGTWVSKDSPKNRQVLVSTIKGYAGADCPAIAFLNGTTFWRYKKDNTRRPHSVLVIGYRQSCKKNEYESASTFICHDPGKQPYLEANVDHFLNSIADFRISKSKAHEKTELSLHFVCPKFIHTQPAEFLRGLIRDKSYSGQYWRRFLESPVEESHITVDLCNRDDLLVPNLLPTFVEGNTSGFVEKLANRVRRMQFDEHYWRIAARCRDDIFCWILGVQKPKPKSKVEFESFHL